MARQRTRVPGRGIIDFFSSSDSCSLSGERLLGTLRRYSTGTTLN